MQYFLYARKSTDDKARQIQSINDQVSVLSRLASERSLDVIDTITDEKSAKAPGRLGFDSMLRRIQGREASGVICWDIDRLTRNPKDSGDLMWLLQQGVIRHIVTPYRTFDQHDSSIMLSVETGRSTDYVRKLSIDVKRGMTSKLERGWMACRAPIGYRNETEALKGQKRILPDPQTFDALRSLWKRLLHDQCSTMQLYRVMQSDYPVYRNGRVLAFSTFHRIFQNPFYCGKFHWKDELIQGAHEPMITQAEFDQAQVYLENGADERQRTLVFPLRGAFHCGTCGAFITAERKTKGGRDYDYYRCGHRKREVPCHEKPLAASSIYEQLFEELDQVSIPKEIIQFGMKVLEEMDADSEVSAGEKQFTEAMEALKRRIRTIEENIVEEKDGDIRVLMKAKLSELRTELRSTEGAFAGAQEARLSRHQTIRDSLDLIMRSKMILEDGSPEDQLRVLRGLGSNWKLSDKKLHYEPHFVPLALRRVKVKHAKELARFEPTGSLLETAQSLRCELATTVWSG